MDRFAWRGTTAMVTGASSGIGAAFARELAGRGASLVLVARREERLRRLAAELPAAHAAHVVLPVDLAAADAVDRVVVGLAAQGVEVDALVNNAGFATHGPFATNDPRAVAEEIAVNVGTLVGLTRAMVPGMVRRDRGAVVNVASTAAFQPVPSMAVYGATKAFVLSFTEALWGELEPSGVRTLAVCPGATRTEFFDAAGGAPAVGQLLSAERVVAIALDALDRRRPSVVTGPVNALGAQSARLLPRRTLIRTTRRVMARSAAAAR